MQIPAQPAATATAKRRNPAGCETTDEFWLHKSTVNAFPFWQAGMACACWWGPEEAVRGWMIYLGDAFSESWMNDNRGCSSVGLAILGVLVSVLYLANLSAGFIEVPDNLPFIGNLDEVFFSGVLFASLARLGIRLPFMGNAPTKVSRTTPYDPPGPR